MKEVALSKVGRARKSFPSTSAWPKKDLVS